MKTVPIPVQVPDWVKWVAQDEDGTWVAYEIKPHSTSIYWHVPIGQWESLFNGHPNPNWRETLREVE